MSFAQNIHSFLSHWSLVQWYKWAPLTSTAHHYQLHKTPSKAPSLVSTSCHCVSHTTWIILMKVHLTNYQHQCWGLWFSSAYLPSSPEMSEYSPYNHSSVSFDESNPFPFPISSPVSTIWSSHWKGGLNVAPIIFISSNYKLSIRPTIECWSQSSKINAANCDLNLGCFQMDDKLCQNFYQVNRGKRTSWISTPPKNMLLTLDLAQTYENLSCILPLPNFYPRCHWVRTLPITW